MLCFVQAPFNWDYDPQDLPRSSALLVHYLVHHRSPSSSSSPWSLSATWSPSSDSRHLHLSLCCSTPSHHSPLYLLACQPYQSLTMPRRQRGTSRRGRGCHARSEGHILLSSQASNNGFDLEFWRKCKELSRIGRTNFLVRWGSRMHSGATKKLMGFKKHAHTPGPPI